MSHQHPELPLPNYGAVKMRRPASRPIILWSSFTVVIASLVLATFFISTDDQALGFELGGRDSWNPSELLWFTVVIGGIGWLVLSSVVWGEPQSRLEEDIQNGRRDYAVNFIKPWLYENYGLTVKNEQAITLFEGRDTRVYRTADDGSTQWVRVTLQGASNIRGAAVSSYYDPRYTKDEPLRLVIHPDPTKPPAPFEFTSA